MGWRALERYWGRLLAECAEIESNDLRVVQELTAGSCVGILTLVENIATVTNLKTAPGVLLDHDCRHAGLVDFRDPQESLILADRGLTG